MFSLMVSKLVESLVPEVSQNLKDRPLEGLSKPLHASEWGATMATRLKRDFDCLGIDYNAFYPGETRLQALEELQSAPEVSEYQVFFYHSDHLGSSSFITDANGDATQHLQYLPFGEDWSLSGAEGHEQNTAAYLSPYTFSGKERDVEMRSIREDLQKASTERHLPSCFGSEMFFTPELARELVRSFTSDKESELFN